MRRKSIAFGIVLILLALYMIVSTLGYAPAMPFFKAAFTLVLLYTTIRGFMRLHFTAGFLSVAILGCLHDELLHIEALTPWTLLIAGLLLGIAFDTMFRGVRKKHRYTDSDGSHIEWDFKNYAGESDVEDDVDGQSVRVSNTFGAKSKYVNSEAFRKAEIENSFGECNVYFNNAILAGDRAAIQAENHFGQTNLYLPRTWRVSIHEESAFGNVHIHGRGSAEEGAPLIELTLESNFGDLNVYFE